MIENKNIKVLVRGAGDLASGIIGSLSYAGFSVVCTDVENPSCIRTEVSYSSAIYDGSKTLAGVTVVYVKDVDEIDEVLKKGNAALIIDEKLSILKKMKFDVVVDAIIAKKNLGTNIDMAKFVIGVGPGFTAKKDCHVAIETMRGHNLGRIIEEGSPLANTGIPGLIASHGADRVMHSPCDGIFNNVKKIGDKVSAGETLSIISEYVENEPTGKKVELKATIDGILRGILRNGFHARAGLKCADIDPRLSEYDNCFTISDKARNIGSAVTIAIIHNFIK